MRRFFNQTEKTLLYIAADGHCESCDTPLESGWHADHIHPYSKNGATALVNGQALCPACNLKKGNTSMTQIDYSDTFQPRPFQQDLIDSVVNRHKAGKKLTVSIASPGSGKTLAYQAAATALIREGAIDLVAVFAPRLTLATQCELEYHDAEGRGHYDLFDPASRLESIVHRENKTPLTSPGVKKTGYVTTYSSLVTDPKIHLHWARRNAGRFLLVGDEAQFLGSAGEVEGDESGTKAGRYFQEMHEYAAHTLMLTGTEKRADNSELVLAPYETRDDGKLYLVPDVRARYSDGIAQGYLRPFEATKVDLGIERVYLDSGETTVTQLSDNSDQLAAVLRQPNVWQELVNKCVEQLKWAQHTNSGFKGLIACQRQDDARKVHVYLKGMGVSADLAVSADGDDADQALDAFKFNSSDFLVTVRKAFLGYDCKQITVVGLLTNYRDDGHLEQLVGRGLRVWDGAPVDEQRCRIIAPNDQAMVRFLERLKEENDQGLGKRAKSPGERVARETEPPTESVVINDAWVTEVTASGHDGYVDRDGVLVVSELYEKVPDARKLSQASLFKIVSLVQGQEAPAAPEVPSGPRLTRKQKVAEYLKEADDAVKALTSARAKYAKGSDRPWVEEKIRLTNLLNDKCGVRSSNQIKDIELARRYRDEALSLGRLVAS